MSDLAWLHISLRTRVFRRVQDATRLPVSCDTQALTHLTLFFVKNLELRWSEQPSGYHLENGHDEHHGPVACLGHDSYPSKVKPFALELAGAAVSQI